MDFKAIAKNKWVWGGVGLVAVYVVYRYVSAGPSDAVQGTGNPYASFGSAPISYGVASPSAIGTGGAVSGGDTSASSLSYLTDLISLQTLQAQNDFGLQSQQQQNQFVLGQQSIAANLDIAKTNAAVTNNAEMVSLFNNTTDALAKGYLNRVTGNVDLGGSVGSFDIAAISGKNAQANAQLISGTKDGVAYITLPNGANVISTRGTNHKDFKNLPTDVSL